MFLVSRNILSENYSAYTCYFENRIPVKTEDWYSQKCCREPDFGFGKTLSPGTLLPERRRTLDNRTPLEEKILRLTFFPDWNPTPIVGINTRRVITFADSATQKTYNVLGVPENPVLFFPDNKVISKSPLSRKITLNTAYFSENIARIYKFQEVALRSSFFKQTYKE